MIRTSFWEKQHFFAHYDIIIVGAGLIGLCTSLYLRRSSKSKKILVLDRASLPLGASTRNAGFACFGSPSEILSDLENHSFPAVCELIKKRYRGWNMLFDLLGAKRLRYEATGGYEVFRETDAETYSKCLALIKPINEATQSLMGIDLYSEDPGSGVGRFAHVISAPHEGLIDPGSMIKNLLKLVRESDIDVYLGLPCEQLIEHDKQIDVVTPRGALSADQVIVATNGFARQLLPASDIKPVRNQVLVTTPLQHVPEGAFHCDEGYLYFRNLQSRLLIGGGRNVALDEEATASFDLTTKIQDNLMQFVKAHITQESFEIEFSWSGILGFGNTKIPQVQRQSDRLVLAAGMGGMGIAVGAAVANDAAVEALR